MARIINKEEKRNAIALSCINLFCQKGIQKTSIEEIAKNACVAKGTIYLYFKLALNTGARLSTLRNISKKDIDFTHNLITLKDFKNNSTYKTFLNSQLKELLQNRTENININDKVLSTYPAKRIKKILDDLFNQGIDINDRKNRVVFHTLRHTFASHLAINGTPIFTIQKLMNHKDITMTMRYAKLAPESGREAIENLNL